MSRIFFSTVALVLVASIYSSAQPPLPPRYLTPEQRAARLEAKKVEASEYGVNIIRLLPLRSIGDGGIGIGMDYERIFGIDRNVGLVLPLSITFMDNYYGNGTNATNYNQTDAFFTFSPGIKIYPFGQRKVTYAVGPNLLIGYGVAPEGYAIQPNNNPTNRFRLGLIANNYLNVQLTPQFNFGVELGFGVRYLDIPVGDRINNGSSTGIQGAGNFGLSFGYRF